MTQVFRKSPREKHSDEWASLCHSLEAKIPRTHCSTAHLFLALFAYRTSVTRFNHQYRRSATLWEFNKLESGVVVGREREDG